MGTPAAVYVSALDKAVRVNYDGYPDHMLPVLTRLVNEGLLEAFVSHSEYSSLSLTEEEYAEVASSPRSNAYIAVPHVGFAYKDDARVITATAHQDGTVTFSQNEDHAYVVNVDGTIREVVVPY